MIIALLTLPAIDLLLPALHTRDLLVAVNGYGRRGQGQLIHDSEYLPEFGGKDDIVFAVSLVRIVVAKSLALRGRLDDLGTLLDEPHE
jgi:hypothetical protein